MHLRLERNLDDAGSFTVCESIDFTSLTTAITNSLKVVTLSSISFAGRAGVRPDHGNYRNIDIREDVVGVVTIDVKPRTRIRMEATIKV